MAIINPTYDDFKNHQIRALDFGEYRSTTNVLRAASLYFKVFAKSTNLNYLEDAVGSGLEIDAYHQDDNGTEKLYIIITKGSCIKDNQVIVFNEDFTFEYDIPSNTTTYNIYIRYEYVDEYPANIATLEVITGDSPSVTDEYLLLAKVTVDPSNITSGDQTSGIIVDTSPRDALLVDNYFITASSIIGGAENTIVYQKDYGVTGFIPSPSSANQVLFWNGSDFTWGMVNDTIHATCADIATDIAGGNTNQILYQTSSNNTDFIPSPSNANQFLLWDGSNFVWYNLSNIDYATHSCYSCVAECATTVLGGSNNQILYQTSTDNTGFIDTPSASNTYLKWDGNTYVWDTKIEFAQNILGGTINQIVYQTGINQTGFIDQPQANTFLYFNGSSYIWKTDIEKAYNICGGQSNQLVYQSAPDTTAFIDQPTTGNTYLKWTGTTFAWDVAEAHSAECAYTLMGGSANQILYQSDTDSTSFIQTPLVENTFLKWNGTTFTWDSVTEYSRNITGGNSNQLLVQTGTNTTDFIVAPTDADTFLKWDGNAFVWSSVLSASIEHATCADNLTGGAAHQIPVQSSPNTTNFIDAPSTSGTYLMWNGANFIWTQITHVDFASDILGGAENQIVYQLDQNSTAFIDAPTSDNVYLKWDSTNGFHWDQVSTSGDTVDHANLADNIAGGGANQILYQTGANYTDFISAPSDAGSVLAWDGIHYTWMTSIIADQARNIAGGDGNQLVYQSSLSTTSFISAPTDAGQVLSWDGNNFVWTTPSSSGGSSDHATLADNIAGGYERAVVIQTGTNQTSFSFSASPSGPIYQYLYYDRNNDKIAFTSEHSTSTGTGTFVFIDDDSNNKRVIQVVSSGTSSNISSSQTLSESDVRTQNATYGIYSYGAGAGIAATGGTAGVVAASNSGYAIYGHSLNGFAGYFKSNNVGVAACGTATGIFASGGSVSASSAIFRRLAGSNSNAMPVAAVIDDSGISTPNGTLRVMSGDSYGIGLRVDASGGSCFTGGIDIAKGTRNHALSIHENSENEIVYLSGYRCTLCSRGYVTPIYGYATNIAGIIGHAVSNYGVGGYTDNGNTSVYGNTPYVQVSDENYKIKSDICVQDYLRRCPIPVYKYTYTDDNTRTFTEFIGPTAQDIENTFDLNIHEPYEYTIPFEKAYPGVKEPEPPVRPKNYNATWSYHKDQYTLNEILQFEKYETDYKRYEHDLQEYKKLRKQYEENPNKEYKQILHTVDGLALGLAIENFQCIEGHNQEISEIKSKLESLETKIQSLIEQQSNTGGS